MMPRVRIQGVQALALPAIAVVASAILAGLPDRSQRRVLEGHRGSVLAVAFSPKGDILASGSRDKTVKLWDVRTGKLLRTLTESAGDVHSVVFAPRATCSPAPAGTRSSASMRPAVF